MKCCKVTALAFLAVLLMCISAFAATIDVNVTRKSYSKTDMEEGYLLLTLDKDSVEELFDYPGDQLVPGDIADGHIRFALNPGIMPVRIKLTAANTGDDAAFNNAEIRITRGSQKEYEGSLYNVTDLDIGFYSNNTSSKVYDSIQLELWLPKQKSNNSIQGTTLSFDLSVVADMADYKVIKPDNYSSGGRIEIYQSLYNDQYYFPASGIPALENQHNMRGESPVYLPDYQVKVGNDNLIGTSDDYYVDYSDGLNVYPGQDGTFGTSDDRKDLQNGSNIERGICGDASEEFGGGKARSYQNGKRYTNGSDKIPGTLDDILIYRGRDGIYGTELDYILSGNNTNTRPGKDLIWGTEDDETWHNGNDGIPGNMDDRFLGYPNKEITNTGSWTGGGGGGGAITSEITGTNNVPSSPVAFAKPVEGSWEFDGKNWRFTLKNGEPAKNRWVCIYSKVMDQSYWYFFDGNGIMQTGWQTTGSGKWYRLHSVNDARLGAMEKGLFYEPEDGKYYYFDRETGVLRTGWIKINDKYYYFTETPTGLASWFWNTALGRWAFNSLNGHSVGSLYVNEVTPDGWKVDSSGARIKKVK